MKPHFSCLLWDGNVMARLWLDYDMPAVVTVEKPPHLLCYHA